MILNVRTDRGLLRCGRGNTRFALATLQAPVAISGKVRTPVNVALVFDRSGSMGGRKIELAREALVRALGALRPADRFAIVAYDHETRVVVESTPATPEAVQNAKTEVMGIAARGDTDLAGGWLAGCEQVALHLDASSIGRCLLLTDGLANRGITDHAELGRHAEELRERGIATSTFGMGADFDEALLQHLSIRGGGHFYFIEQAVQISDLLASELGEALEVVARGVTVDLRLPEGVAPGCLNDYTAGPLDSTYQVKVGDLVSGQELVVAFKFTIDEGAEGAIVPVQVSVAVSGEPGKTTAALTWMYADDAACDTQPCDWAVTRRVISLIGDRARLDALALHKRNAWPDAVRRLERAIGAMARLAGDDPEARAQVEALRGELDAYGRPLTALESKGLHFTSSVRLKDLNLDGTSRKLPPRR